MEASGKTFAVFGGGSGIGRAAARRWAAAGGRVAIADIDADGMAATADGLEMHAERVDVTERAQVQATLERIEATLGPIDVVVNGAAIQPTGLLLEQHPDEILRVMDVNYGGLVNVSVSALPRLLERGSGSLVNFASIAGWVPNLHFGAYGASKFAQVCFTEVLYHENRGRGVHIACVCPPQVDTPLRAQARSDPQIMQTGPAPMSPERVVDAVERAIDRGRFWVVPGAHAVMGIWLRRFWPSLLWRIDHRAEGF